MPPRSMHSCAIWRKLRSKIPKIYKQSDDQEPQPTDITQNPSPSNSSLSPEPPQLFSQPTITSGSIIRPGLIIKPDLVSGSHSENLEYTDGKGSHNVSEATNGNLWDLALERLSDVDQRRIKNLRSKSTSLNKEIDDVFKLLKSMQEECEEKFQNIPISGRHIIPRDYLAKIFHWLTQLKKVGDVVANIDPVHAALPWAVVRFIIQVAVSNREQMAALLANLDIVTHIISLCKIYEYLYTPDTTSNESAIHLNTTLIKLYAAILQFAVDSHTLFTTTVIDSLIDAIISPDRTSDSMKEIQRLSGLVSQAADACEKCRRVQTDSFVQSRLDLLQGLLINCKTLLVRTDERVASILEDMEEEKRLKTLEWISPVPYTKHHNDVEELRTSNTCQWLTQREVYKIWNSSSASGFFWLQGLPGVGKTFLASRVIDELSIPLRRLGTTNQEGFAFFYCKHNEEKRRDPLSVLRSLLRQLSKPFSYDQALFSGLHQLHNVMRSNGSDLTFTICSDWLLKMVNTYPKTTIVLDALDECDEGNRAKLMNALDNLIKQSQRPLKIFISSRPDADIERWLRDLPSIAMKERDTRYDISIYIDQEIMKHPKWNTMESTLQEEIIWTLSCKSHGMFQWTYLQIKQLLECDSPQGIRERLGRLPKDLEDAYDEIYERILRCSPNIEVQYAIRAFQWVMASVQPTRGEFLLPAICQDPDQNTINACEGVTNELILKVCRHLLVLDSRRQLWRFSHRSVIEYFERKHWGKTEPKRNIAKVCLMSLVSAVPEPISSRPGQDFVEVRRMTDNDGKYELLHKYSRVAWEYHINSIPDYQKDPRIMSLLLTFLGHPNNSSQAFRYWYSKSWDVHDGKSSSNERSAICFPHTQQISPISSPLFAACTYGFVPVLRKWCEYPTLDLQQRNSLGQTLFDIAAHMKRRDMCEFLIKESGVNFPSGPETSKALVYAVSSRLYWLIDLILENGADPNFELGSELRSPLVAAIKNTASSYRHRVSQTDFDIITTLLKHGADPDLRPYGQESALEIAIRQDKESSTWFSNHVVKILSDKFTATPGPPSLKT